MHKLAVGRDLLTESAMASQPTRLQCENVAGLLALYRIGRTLVTTVNAQHT